MHKAVHTTSFPYGKTPEKKALVESIFSRELYKATVRSPKHIGKVSLGSLSSVNTAAQAAERFSEKSVIPPTESWEMASRGRLIYQ